MKKFTFLLFSVISTGLFAQTKHTVTVTSTFSPSSLTITVGDTVEFVNQSGFHWVDGTQGTFPSNPASFDNQSQSGTGWTYEEVFTVAGNYDYRCGIHTATMQGSITVQASSSVNEVNQQNSYSFYPNPTTQTIIFNNVHNIKSIALYSLKGNEVLRFTQVKSELDVSTLSPGIYFMEVTDTQNKATTEKIIIK